MLKYFPCCKRHRRKKARPKNTTEADIFDTKYKKLQYPDMNEELECGPLAWRHGERLQLSLEEKAPRTCGRQSGAAQGRSLDNSVIKCF